MENDYRKSPIKKHRFQWEDPPNTESLLHRLRLLRHGRVPSFQGLHDARFAAGQVLAPWDFAETRSGVIGKSWENAGESTGKAGRKDEKT